MCIQKSSNSYNELITPFPHPDFSDVLYKHLKSVKNVFFDIKGHHDIAYFALSIVNPENELVIFSSHPNIEFNIFESGIWKVDPVIKYSREDSSDRVLFWSKEYQDLGFELKKIRMINNHLFEGVTILKIIDEFCIGYSFGFNSLEIDNLNLEKLKTLGNFAYRELKEIYMAYSGKIKPPKLSDFLRDQNKPKLYLVVNNPAR